MFAYSLRFCKCCLPLMVLLASVVGARAGSAPIGFVFTCDGLNGTVINNGNGTYGLSCPALPDGVTLTNASMAVLNGNLSDLRFQGIWTVPNGVKGIQNDDFVISPGFLWTLPPGPTVQAWQELHGTMNVAGGSGTISDLGGLDNSTCDGNTGTAFQTINGGGPINAASAPVTCIAGAGSPPWARSATYTLTWNNVAPNSTIRLFAGEGDNYWIPEPSTLAVMIPGLAGFLWTARRVAQPTKF